MKAQILVVDGEPLVRSVITKILEREGYSVYATDDVQAAAEIVGGKQPDLLLTNLYLPGNIRGHDVAERLKQLRPQMKVMIVAGLPDDERVYDETKGSGFEPFPKPFTAEALTEKVAQVLGSNRAV